MENVDLVNEVVVVPTEEPVQQEEVAEIKQEPKKRGRKPKAAAAPLPSQQVAVFTPQGADQGEEPVPAPEPVAVPEPISELPAPSGVQGTKPKAKRATRTAKKTIEVIPIEDTLEESQVQAQIHEAPVTSVKPELNDAEKEQLLHEYMRQQQLNRRIVKQNKYKQLLTRAF